MFKFLKKKQNKETEMTNFHFNDSVLKTMSNEVIRCEDINVYFSGPDAVDVGKYVTHDDIRTAMIKIGYAFSYNNIVSSKLSFEGAIRLELNKMLDESGVQCDRVRIQEISKLY